jgi:alpha-D-ribose 1-methylphosphonate 5-triphosphate synthase subunit PhnG
MAENPVESPETLSRRRALGLLVRATAKELQAPLAEFWPGLAVRDLKPPEAGLVMLRGRAGGDGAMFNLAEATVARAIVELDSGERGFGHVLGRDLDQAHRIAIFDALGQRPDDRAQVDEKVLAPIAARLQAERQRHAAETAATRVDFFTLVRGEDAA